MARRLIGAALSADLQDATLAGGTADSPDVPTEYDGNLEWVLLRQDSGGVGHTLARHFRGSMCDPPRALDADAPSHSPHVAIGGDGAGLDLRGAQTLPVLVDGKPAGTTRAESIASLRVTAVTRVGRRTVRPGVR